MRATTARPSPYLTDPDGNGVELYYDRPWAEWFEPDGSPVLKVERFDPRELLARAETGDQSR
jgi:catechol 2,3-dioxygenase